MYVNMLIDWNQSGEWSYDHETTFLGVPIPEHVLENFLVPANYSGPLSALAPPDFRTPPNGGYFWSRITITESDVSGNWNGSGQFNEGETEDYLLYVNPYSVVPLSPWAIVLGLSLIGFFILIRYRRYNY
jgi:hypothetical protein